MRTGLESVVIGGETRASCGGGETRTLGVRPGLMDMALFPLRTELLLPPRRQEVAVSDLEGGTELVELFEVGAPREVPPLVAGAEDNEKLPRGRWPMSSSAKPGIMERLPNLPPKAAVIGTWSSLGKPS